MPRPQTRPGRFTGPLPRFSARPGRRSRFGSALFLVLTRKHVTSIIEKLYYQEKGLALMRQVTRRARAAAALTAVAPAGPTRCSFGGGGRPQKGGQTVRPGCPELALIDPPTPPDRQ